MYPTCEGLTGVEVRGKVIVVDGLAYATVLLISDFEGDRVSLKE